MRLYWCQLFKEQIWKAHSVQHCSWIIRVSLHNGRRDICAFDNYVSNRPFEVKDSFDLITLLETNCIKRDRVCSDVHRTFSFIRFALAVRNIWAIFRGNSTVYCRNFLLSVIFLCSRKYETWKLFLTIFGSWQHAVA